jgi:hypothetical protein
MSITTKLFDRFLAEQAEFVNKFEKGKQAQVNVTGGVGIMAMYHADEAEFEKLTHDLENGRGLTPVERTSGEHETYSPREVVEVEASEKLKSEFGYRM